MGSCSKGKGSECVRDTIKKIIAAQDEVAERDHCCDVSCERSIRDLLSPAGAGMGDTTIPFTLICKDCKPFIGSGARFANNMYQCLESPFFRAKKFVDDSKDCVKLELLIPINGGNSCSSRGKKGGVCDFLDMAPGFYETGVCITVDLDCFCGISCLSPTTPEPYPSQAPAHD
ncbi:CotY/CotZ family spore coat protein [Halobacillus mangrovi]|uniref:Spore coat protein n=1 Tax=Halobacillus mangrovi TaxID=402384 RepID=A0A1W5ZYS7_9BACI|nr:CotY/CotZ family spore coat protein [Halobacillus mangrovi]ARI78423.1 hypothetical protein HM131_16970 [Halobacillus mangrovi]